MKKPVCKTKRTKVLTGRKMDLHKFLICSLKICRKKCKSDEWIWHKDGKCQICIPNKRESKYRQMWHLPSLQQIYSSVFIICDIFFPGSKFFQIHFFVHCLLFIGFSFLQKLLILIYTHNNWTFPPTNQPTKFNHKYQPLTCFCVIHSIS